jgi:hypothetical protein
MGPHLLFEGRRLGRRNQLRTARTLARRQRAGGEVEPDVLAHRGNRHAEGPGDLGLGASGQDGPDDAFTQIGRISLHPASLLSALP